MRAPEPGALVPAATTASPTRTLVAIPLADITRLRPVHDATVWHASSGDPQFLLEGELPWSASGVYLVEVDVHAVREAGGVPMLYFDFGEGFTGADALPLMRGPLSPRAYSGVFRLSAWPQRIRFDPCTAPGDFIASDVAVTAIPEEAAIEMGIVPAPQPAQGAPAALPPPETEALRVGAVLHLHYQDLWPEMAEYLERIPGLARLYVSLTELAHEALEPDIRRRFPMALVRKMPNRGRDVLPFLQWLDLAEREGIDVLCKIHTKRSPHVKQGDAWRHDLLGKLLGSEAQVREHLAAFAADPKLGLLGPAGHVVPSTFFSERNAALVDRFCLKMGRDGRAGAFDYSAGSMFWARVDALRALHRLGLRDEDFEVESGQVDGTVAHALERCFTAAAEVRGYRIAETAHDNGLKVSDFAPPAVGSYTSWIEHFEVPAARYGELARAQAAWSDPPTISIVMPTYQTPRELLEAAIGSVLAQVYPRWELCIADDASRAPHVREVLEAHARRDPRVRVVFREANGHISEASNSALALATGEYTALLDHDDLLHPLALHYVAERLVADRRLELVFSDEDKIARDGRRVDPYFKCELNEELLLAHNMVSHLGVYRTARLRAIGGFRKGYEGSQDYDLALRFLEGLDRARVAHVPRVLYHWRIMEGSTAQSADEKPYAAIAARRAIGEHLARLGHRADVVPAPEAPNMNRVRFAVRDPAPSVTIVIPTRDRADLLTVCVESIFAKTTYPNYSILVVDNRSSEPATLALFERLRERGVRIRRDDGEFNFSAINNRAVHEADGEFVCLMNNDIEVTHADWLHEMVGMADRPGVGAVGARLWYPDGRLQHGGVIVGIRGVASHAHKYARRGEGGYFGRAVLHQAMSAVTAACLLVRRSIYEDVGGLDESFRVAFNDIDFCLRVRAAGYRNVWTPYAEMVHHESASRGFETTPEKQARFLDEVKRMQERWGEKLAEDPAYSPNLSLENEDFELAWPPRVPLPAALPAGAAVEGD